VQSVSIEIGSYLTFQIQITNFFVAFTMLVLLSWSSSGICFLFIGVCIINVDVRTVFLPETRGRDLDTIRKAVSLHEVTDISVQRMLKELTTCMLGPSPSVAGPQYRALQPTEGEEVELQSLQLCNCRLLWDSLIAYTIGDQDDS
jgi:hypothetical protein